MITHADPNASPSILIKRKPGRPISGRTKVRLSLSLNTGIVSALERLANEQQRPISQIAEAAIAAYLFRRP